MFPAYSQLKLETRVLILETQYSIEHNSRAHTDRVNP